MAELKIQPNEIRDALANFVKSYDPGTAARDEVGTVSQAGDGIARVEGLPSTMANELLQFENGTLGLALNLDVDADWLPNLLFDCCCKTCFLSICNNGCNANYRD